MFFNRLSKKTDEELITLVQQGDSRAMTELYHRYDHRLLRYFYRMLWKEEALAQDFLHDLFVKIIENAGQFRAGSKFSTWIYSIAHNMCKNEYRKQAFRESTTKTSLQEPGLADGIHQELERKEFQQALEEALDRLDEDDKHLFTLRHALEMPLDEIALTLGCALGTVKSRLFYLKKKLAKHLYMFHTVKE
jgi:RNA polymerase sigma-70 factor (ECF subfamily)